MLARGYMVTSFVRSFSVHICETPEDLPAVYRPEPLAQFIVQGWTFQLIW